MELTELQRHWNAFGEQDQLWSILSLPGKRFGKWDSAEFFRNGEAQVAGLLACLGDRGITVRRGKALDFGCGVGRLTQALCHEFESCVGVDIAPSMVETARRLNRHGGRCEYVLNGRDDLATFDDDTFDLIYSIIVLQHMEPGYALKYIGEFLRVLAPGGVLVFHLPAGPAPPVDGRIVAHATAATAPLRNAAYRAVLKLVEVPASMAAGAVAEVRVRYENRSPENWPALGGGDDRRFQVRLGNHWLDAKGNGQVVRDDGRAPLPGDLRAGESGELSLRITAPFVPGDYLLEVDLVQEHVAWFKDRGSATVTAPVTVVGDPGRPDAGFTPVMEMHSIPREEVLAFIAGHGGKTLDVQRVNEGGPLLEYNYYATKGG